MIELTREDLEVGMIVLFTIGNDDPNDVTDYDISRVEAISPEIVLYTGHIHQQRQLNWDGAKFTSLGARHRLWRRG